MTEKRPYIALACSSSGVASSRLTSRPCFVFSFSSRIRPFSNASVSSWLNRSRLRIMVSPASSPSSLNSSTCFTRPPVGYVALVSLSEEAVQHTAAGQQSNVALVQRCYRPAAHLLLLPNQDAASVLHCNRAFNGILYCV